MAAILLGLAGLTFGFSSDETGGVIQSIQIKKGREKQTVRNKTGEVAAASFYNPTEEISYDFVPSGGGGVSSISPGVAVSLANYTPLAGIIITEEVTISRKNTEYESISSKAIVYPLILS